MKTLLPLLLLSVAIRLCGVEYDITAGFHNRASQHPSGAIDAWCIGVDGTKNPLGDRTELLGSNPGRATGSGGQTTTDWPLRGKAIRIEATDVFDARGTVQILVLRRGQVLKTLSSAQDAWTYDGNGFPDAVRGVGAVRAQPSGYSGFNAGGHIVVHVTSITIELEQTNGEGCDGTVDDPHTVTVTPASIASEVAIEKIDALADPEANRINNPARRPISYVKGGDDRTWTVPNLRWYQQSAECGDRAGWAGEIWVAFRGDRFIYTTEDQVTFVNAELSDDGSTCLSGRAAIRRDFKGQPVFRPWRRVDGGWDCTIELWPVSRDVQATTTTFTTPRTSQFYGMIAAEERFHANDQFENPAHPIIGQLYTVRGLADSMPLTGFGPQPSASAARAAARAAFERGLADYRAACKAVIQARRCDLEQEAKAAIGATHLLRLVCAYPACGGGAGGRN